MKKALFAHQVTAALPAAVRTTGPAGMNHMDWNAYAALCPTRQALDRIADKWTVLILGLLCDGPMRFNAIRRRVEGISQKVLSQTLKSLERDGLVVRTAYPTVPVTVEYAITPIGASLADTVTPLRRWAEENIESILRARRAYDQAEVQMADAAFNSPIQR